ncbi:Fic family protein [Butyricicoccus sp. 1XD8-22]|nr:Fic family protein [Butyricicoccus sp. 1XD8-22]
MAYIDLRKLSYSDRDSVQSIYENRFHSDSSIHLPINIHDFPAFFIVVPEMLETIVHILRMENHISALLALLPGHAKRQYRYSCLISEIILTNEIENVHSSRREIGDLLMDLAQYDSKKRFQGLVNKYNLLLDFSINKLQTCQDIRDIFDELVSSEIQADAPDHMPDGRIFRKESVTVYSAAEKPIHIGICPETSIIEKMEQSLQILNDKSIEMLLRISIFHYLFGYIHPFYDGNGRVNRFISSSLLADYLDQLTAFHLSLTIKENLRSYYQSFEICNSERNRGDLTPFILTFLKIISLSTDQLYNDLYSKTQEWNHYQDLANTFFPKPELDVISLLIQASLFSEDGISTQELLSVLHISRQALLGRLRKIPKSLYSIQKRKNAKYYQLELPVLERYAEEKITSDNT